MDARQLEAVLDCVFDCVVRLDSAGRIATANRATEELFGYAREELVGNFRFHTLAEARDVSDFIALCFQSVPDLRLGLVELTTNAIEHGNLGITYADKSELLIRDAWETEVERRQNLPENAGKFAELHLEVSPQRLSMKLRDQGRGFDWSAYQEFSAERAADPHGRGIAMARALAFDSLEYLGNGNELRCSVSLNPSDELAK